MFKLPRISLLIVSILVHSLSFSQIFDSISSKLSNDFFIENKGQWPKEIFYLATTKGLNFWITDKGMVLDFYSSKRNPDGIEGCMNTHRSGHVIVQELKGAKTAKIEGKRKLGSYYNYFKGNDPEKWTVNVPLFKEVIVKDIYEGIDLRYYFEDNSIRYDFIISPGADGGEIAFSLEGTDNYFIDKQGSLVFKTRFGEVKQTELFTYQTNNLKKTKINSRFILREKEITFHIGEYDKNRTLIIDPLIWSTFLGGSGDEWTRSVAADNLGNLIVDSSTDSPSFPSTAGAYDQTQNGNYDICISKINSTATGLIYSTFIGGSQYEASYRMAVDAVGDIYFIGYTGSTDFPVSATAFDQSYNGSGDATVTKINSTGNALIYSTYVGGSSYDYCFGIAVDNNNCAYITGPTQSNDYPTTSSAYDQTLNSTIDVYVTKLNASGTALIYSTYLGGTGGDYGRSISVDGGGNVYIAGETSSFDFPTTAGAFSNTKMGNFDDVFVTKLNPTGSTLVFSTFIGGTNADACYSSTIDLNGNTYLVGWTVSSDYPTTAGSFDPTYNGANDGILTKLNSTGSGLLFSTYIAGTNHDQAEGITLDGNGNIQVAGFTLSTDFPLTATAYDQTQNGDRDVFVSTFNNSGSALLYSTLIGGAASDIGYAIAANSQGSSFIAGEVLSPAYPTTFGAYDQTYNGNLDVFITRIDCSSPIAYAPIATNSAICVGQTLSLSCTPTNVVSYNWNGPNGFNSTQQNTVIANVSVLAGGVYTLFVTDGNGCVGVSTLNVIVNTNPTPTIISNVPVCSGSSLSFSFSPLNLTTYTWTGPGTFSSSLQYPQILNVNFTHTGVYTLSATDVYGCVGTGSLNIVVYASPNATASSNAPLCSGAVLNLNSLPNGLSSYNWQGPNGFISSSQNPTFTVNTLFAGNFTLIATDINGCSASAVTNVVVDTIDLNIVQNGMTLTAVQNSGQYQWINCLNNTTIAGEVNQSFLIMNNGVYAAVIINGACSGTTACVAVNSVDLRNVEGNLFKVYPNPSKGSILVEVKKSGYYTLNIIDELGRAVFQEKYYLHAGYRATINVDYLVDGAYTLKIESSSRFFENKKIIICNSAY